MSPTIPHACDRSVNMSLRVAMDPLHAPGTRHLSVRTTMYPRRSRFGHPLVPAWLVTAVAVLLGAAPAQAQSHAWAVGLTGGWDGPRGRVKREKERAMAKLPSFS